MENEKEAFDEIKFDWSNQDISWYGEQYNSFIILLHLLYFHPKSRS
jgi:uncharacterized membrane protein YjdF